MDKKISVVIPCYNGEKYIERCLNSIIKQSYENLEIIVVNDGSTDNTKEIIAPFLTDGRVICIDQPNGGESAARNTGIAAATGEYIGFVDVDDYIMPQMYEKLYTALCAAQAEVAACNFNLVYDDKSRETQTAYSHMPKGVLNIYDDVYGYWAQVCAAPRPNNYVWTRLYRRSTIVDSGVLFEKYIHSADTLFTFKLLPHLTKVVFVNEGLYNYVQRAGSGIHTVADKGNIAVLYANTFQALADYYKENDFQDFLSVLPLHAYTRLRSVFFYSRLSGHSDEQIIANLEAGWKDRDIYKYLTGALK